MNKTRMNSMYIRGFVVLTMVVLASFIIIPPTYLWLNSRVSKKTSMKQAATRLTLQS
jgi:hypothetical protein